MRAVDVMLVIPTLPLTIVLTNIFGKSYFMIVFIFTLFGWQGLARVIRSQVLVLKNTNYIKAAELAGASKWRIMFKHILPGVTHLLIMSTAMTSAGIMILLTFSIPFCTPKRTMRAVAPMKRANQSIGSATPEM